MLRKIFGAITLLLALTEPALPADLAEAAQVYGEGTCGRWELVRDDLHKAGASLLRGATRTHYPPGLDEPVIESIAVWASPSSLVVTRSRWVNDPGNGPIFWTCHALVGGEVGPEPRHLKERK